MEYLLKAKTIFEMEVKKLFQNKKTLISSILVGPVLIFLIFLLVLQVSKNPDPKIEIYTCYPVEEVAVSTFKNVEIKETLDGYEESVSSQKNVVAIVIEENSIVIYYDSSLLMNSEMLYDARKIATNIMVANGNYEEYSIFENNVKNIYKESLYGADEGFITITITITSLIFLVSLMTISGTLAGLSADSICGEKERGTYDALRLSGTKTISIVLGKFFCIFLLGLCMLLANGMAITLGLYNSTGLVFDFLKEGLFKRPLWFISFVLLFSGISMLETSLFFAVSAFFNKVKHAMAYAGIVQIVLSLSSYVPNILGGNSFNYIPISNTLVIFEYILRQEPYAKYVIGSFCISLILSISILALTVKVLGLDETKK